jgi:succinoglycan biosynthesis protein ExoO
MTSFAVVIPLYNKGPHIRRALDSVLTQTCAPMEILVVDDSSTDDGLAQVLAYQDPRIRVIRRSKPGPGGYAARNAAILEARADWIAFLDADDAWLPGHLAALQGAIAADRSGELVCAFSGYMNIYPDGRSEPDPFTSRKGRIEMIQFNFAQLLEVWLELKECPIWTSAAAFRRDTLKESGLFPADRCRRGGDKDLWLRAASKGRCVAAPSADAIYHRDAVNMVTRSNSTAGRHCLCDTIKVMLESAPPRHASLLRRLFNQEVYLYALQASKGGKVQAEAWRGFFAMLNPLRFLVLTGLSSTPGAMAVGCLHKLRGYLR